MQTSLTLELLPRFPGSTQFRCQTHDMLAPLDHGHQGLTRARRLRHIHAALKVVGTGAKAASIIDARARLRVDLTDAAHILGREARHRRLLHTALNLIRALAQTARVVRAIAACLRGRVHAHTGKHLWREARRSLDAALHAVVARAQIARVVLPADARNCVGLAEAGVSLPDSAEKTYLADK